MFDYVLVVVAGGAMFAQAYLGLRVTTRPPSEDRRIRYEAAFIVIGLVGFIAVVWGGFRTADTSSRIENTLNEQRNTLSEQNGFLTGGDSWGWVLPVWNAGVPDVMHLTINNEGQKYPLKGVRVILEAPREHVYQLDVGDVPPRTGILVPGGDLYIPHGKPYHLGFLIGAANGTTSEILDFSQAADGHWKMHVRVFTFPRVGRKTKTLKELNI